VLDIATIVTHPSFIAVVGVAAVGVVWKAAVWHACVNRDRKKFDTFITKVGDDLKEIRNDIKSIFQKLPSDAVAGHSPVQLTDFGKKIAKSVKSSDWANQHAPCLIQQAHGKAEFEIFEICTEYISKTFEKEDDFNAIVRKGAYDCGTSTIDVMKVYQVELRDAVLKLISEGS